MAEAFVSAIIKKLTGILVEEALQRVRLVTGVGEEVRLLRKNLEAIRAVLEDAEEKQMANNSVKLWLDRLQFAAYDMEDVLDDWSAALLKLRTRRDGNEKGSVVKRKVCACISCLSSCHVVRRYDIGLRIKEINTTLEQIALEKDRYDLTKKETRQPRRVESTSFVDVSEIHGRDAVKQEIVTNLVCDTSDQGSGLKTISLVGMGGIGKTALAQMVHNDSEFTRHFDQIIWVCVSDFFDQTRVAKAIIVALEGLNQNSVYLLDSVPVQSLLERICNSIKGKKFFLVLDDVWTEDDEDWKSLKLTFKHGAPGSRILVTTRKVTVAEMMESSHIFHIEELSLEACWSVLSQKALHGKNRKAIEHLEDIGREIAKKCKGLPLAAKTLGGILQSRGTREGWQKVLDSPIWKLDLTKKDTFAPLLLSYYDLPSELRRCFTYCVIFPKDFIIWRQHLIDHWMAQGFLGVDGNLDLEFTGGMYFDCLANRSLFQDFGIDENGIIQTCKMHDFVHDFAGYLVENEFMTKEIKCGECGENSRLDVSSDKTRHLTVMLAEDAQFPVSISGVKGLRSLVTFSGDHAITSEAMRNIFNQAVHLRVLDLSWPDGADHLDKKIPKEIGKLKQLRHLNLSQSWKLTELPETLCELYNLQSLELKGCNKLQKLPDHIWKLINLRYLRTNWCDSLTSYPKGIGRLTSLRNLFEITVRADRNDTTEFSLGDLERLDNLRGVLRLRLVGKRIEATEAKRAKLQNKIHLKELRIKLTGEIEKDDVIGALNPPSTLKVLFYNRKDDWYYPML